MTQPAIKLPAPPSRLPPPPAFGFPADRYPNWRPGQADAVLRTVDGKLRINVECLPTGSGKSLTGVTAQRLTGLRTVYLTRRKGLQSQLTRDFPIHDVRGQSSYQCTFSPGTTVDFGPCHAGMACHYRHAGCPYYDALAVARRDSTRMTVTNYSFWFNQARIRMRSGGKAGGLGPIDLVICDEAHGIRDELTNFLTVELQRADIERLGVGWPAELGSNLEPWKMWARTAALPGVESMLTSLGFGGPDLDDESGINGTGVAGTQTPSPAQVREKRRLVALQERLQSLIDAEGEWVANLSDRGGTFSASPVWPGPYMETYLFQGAAKILMMSATIRPKTMELMGIGASEYSFAEMQSPFPLDRRLVWCIEAPRMNHRIDDNDKQTWMDRIDGVISKRLDRKLIIHVGSYERRNWILQRSRFNGIMLGHSREDVDLIIQRFKHMGAPAILVSQSVGEGYDFPYDECRAQIIAKLPYPDSRDPLVKARTAQDKEYGDYVAMEQVVQAAGRAVRAEDDFAETIIVDGNSKWFFNRNKRFAPSWFNMAVRQTIATPDPPTLDTIRIGGPQRTPTPVPVPVPLTRVD